MADPLDEEEKIPQPRTSVPSKKVTDPMDADKSKWVWIGAGVVILIAVAAALLLAKSGTKINPADFLE